MTRTKRTSRVFDKASKRISSVRSIDPNLVLAEGLNLADYELQVQILQTMISNYNTLLSSVDESAGQIAAQELQVRNYSERMLMAIGLRYGKDSLQYMQAGGKTRKSTNSTKVTELTTTEPIPTTPVAAGMN